MAILADAKAPWRPGGGQPPRMLGTRFIPVWRFRGPQHPGGESGLRTSEPKPHRNQYVASVLSIPKFVREVAARRDELRNRDTGCAAVLQSTNPFEASHFWITSAT